MRDTVRSGESPVLAGVVFATLLSYAAGWWIGSPAVVPIANTLVAMPFLFGALRSGRVDRAVIRMLIWAATLAAAATLWSYAQPGATERLFINAEAYRREMFTWVLTGKGAESNPAQFIPQHLAHAAIFCGLSLATGSLVSMMMGAVLMNYMGHYVGALAAHALRPGLALVLGWHPWAVIRVASFVILGVVLGGPVLSRLGRFEYRLSAQWHWLALAAAGLVFDIVLKWLLAPTWRQLLAPLLT